MHLFISNYVNNIDKKGRVSVPSSFRLLVNSEASSGIVLYKSIKNSCIEACGLSRLQEISKLIDNIDPYSEERDAFETVILGEAVQLSFDSEGRIIIPKELLEYAEIEGQVCFVGKGKLFELWNPNSFKLYSDKVRKVAFEKRLMLKNMS